jgi:AraC-like DNA-binding protein
LGASGSGSLPPSAWDFTDHVRHQIAMRIGREPVTARAIAAAMGLSRRTLDRRLSGHGVSFSKLVDEIRYARARRLLAAGHAPLSDISLALGYAEPSAFSRAFRGWAGCSPQDWRQSREKSAVTDK